MEIRATTLIQDYQPILDGLEHCEEAFRIRLLRELKKEMLQILPAWGLSSSREDYFLHQLTQTWSFESLLDLISEINSRHLKQNPNGHYVYLSSGSQGFRWELRAASSDSIH
jgi:hypothetical protein